MLHFINQQNSTHSCYGHIIQKVPLLVRSGKSTSTRLSDRAGTLSAVVFSCTSHIISVGPDSRIAADSFAALPLVALPSAACRAFHAHTVCLAPLCMACNRVSDWKLGALISNPTRCVSCACKVSMGCDRTLLISGRNLASFTFCLISEMPSRQLLASKAL